MILRFSMQKCRLIFVAFLFICFAVSFMSSVCSATWLRFSWFSMRLSFIFKKYIYFSNFKRVRERNCSKYYVTAGLESFILSGQNTLKKSYSWSMDAFVYERERLMLYKTDQYCNLRCNYHSFFFLKSIFFYPLLFSKKCSYFNIRDESNFIFSEKLLLYFVQKNSRLKIVKLFILLYLGREQFNFFLNSYSNIIYEKILDYY